MKRIVAALAVVLGFAAVSAAQIESTSRGPAEATVLTDAPIHLRPDASRDQLRTAKAGTVLRVLEAEGGWARVEFQDPQFGLRVGYIETRFVRITEPRYLQPMDLSVPSVESAPTPVAKPEGPLTESISRQATEAAAASEAPQYTQTRIPPGFLWTGIGLLIGGAATLVTGLAIDEDTCGYYGNYYYDYYYDCDTFKTWWITSGAAVAAAGAIVLIVGNHNREPVSMSVGPNAFRVRIRF